MRAGKPHVRFDEGGVGCDVWYAATKARTGNSETELCRSLNIVAYSSTLLTRKILGILIFAKGWEVVSTSHNLCHA